MDVVQLARVCRQYGLKAHRLLRRMEEELPEEGGPLLTCHRVCGKITRLVAEGRHAEGAVQRELAVHARAHRPKRGRGFADRGGSRFLVRLLVRAPSFGPIKTGAGPQVQIL